MKELIPELLVNEHCACGENPLWDDARGMLYWCDIPAGRVFEWDAVAGEHRQIFQGPEMGAFTLQSDGSLLLLFTGSAARLDPVTGEVIVLKENITSDTGRFNDCIATPRGDVFAGTVDWEQNRRGALFHLDLQGNATSICSGTACSNGLAGRPTDAVCIGPIRRPKRFICSITTRKAARFLTAARGLKRPD